MASRTSTLKLSGSPQMGRQCRDYSEHVYFWNLYSSIFSHRCREVYSHSKVPRTKNINVTVIIHLNTKGCQDHVFHTAFLNMKNLIIKPQVSESFPNVRPFCCDTKWEPSLFRIYFPQTKVHGSPWSSTEPN